MLCFIRSLILLLAVIFVSLSHLFVKVEHHRNRTLSRIRFLMHFPLSFLPQTALEFDYTSNRKANTFDWPSVSSLSLPSYTFGSLRLSDKPLGVVQAGACAHDTRIEFARTADGSISFTKCHAKRRLIAHGIDRVHCRGFFDFDAHHDGGDRR